MKKILCVCAVGYCRSPTAARILANEPYNYDTRSAGIESCALIPVTVPLLSWADMVVCMEPEQKTKVLKKLKLMGDQKKPVFCLDIPDNWSYNEPELIEIIEAKIKERPALKGGV